MRRIGIGIIGTGGIAATHAKAVQSLEEAELVAGCDIVESRVQDFACRYGVSAVYTDSHAFFQDPRVEAALVCTPHIAHCPLAIQAAQAGVHVMVEKPLSVNLDEADEAIEAARKANIKFGVIFQRRFWPAAQRARKAVEAGKLGKIILGDCIVKWWRPKEYYESRPWRGTWKGEGGATLVNQAIHAIDMYQWLMGPVESVYGLWGNLSHPFIEAEDVAVAALRFRNGALGTILATVSVNPQLGSRVTIHGDTGAAISVLEQPEGRVGVNDIWTIPGEEHEAARILSQEQAQAESTFGGSAQKLSYHGRQIQDFIQSIVDDREPAVTAQEGRKAIEIVMAIYRSNETGQPVTLPLA